MSTKFDDERCAVTKMDDRLNEVNRRRLMVFGPIGSLLRTIHVPMTWTAG